MLLFWILVSFSIEVVVDRIRFAIDEDRFRLFLLRFMVNVLLFVLIVPCFENDRVGDCLSAVCQSVFTPKARLQTERPVPELYINESLSFPHQVQKQQQQQHTHERRQSS